MVAEVEDDVSTDSADTGRVTRKADHEAADDVPDKPRASVEGEAGPEAVTSTPPQVALQRDPPLADHQVESLHVVQFTAPQPENGKSRKKRKNRRKRSEVTLAWDPVTRNAKGEKLTSILGYEVRIRTATHSTRKRVKGKTQITVKLPSGRYRVSVVAVGVRGLRSKPSEEKVLVVPESGKAAFVKKKSKKSKKKKRKSNKKRDSRKSHLESPTNAAEKSSHAAASVAPRTI